MKLLQIFIGIILLSSMTSLEAGVWDRLKSVFSSHDQNEPPTIKVLVIHNKDAVMIEVKGKYHIYDPNVSSKLSTRFVGKSYLMQPLMSGLKWGEEFPGIYQLYLLPAEPTTTIIVDGIEYRGAVYVYDIGGALSIVNEVPIEDYVSAISAKNAQVSTKHEALASLAIIERTKAYNQVQTGKNPYWHVEAQKVGYNGFATILPQSAMEQAITATRHMVMSSTGAYEGVVTPFDANWTASENEQNSKQVLSVRWADAMADKGENAATILSKTFPNNSIRLIYQDDNSKTAAK